MHSKFHIEIVCKNGPGRTVVSVVSPDSKRNRVVLDTGESQTPEVTLANVKRCNCRKPEEAKAFVSRLFLVGHSRGNIFSM